MIHSVSLPEPVYRAFSQLGADLNIGRRSISTDGTRSRECMEKYDCRRSNCRAARMPTKRLVVAHDYTSRWIDRQFAGRAIHIRPAIASWPAVWPTFGAGWRRINAALSTDGAATAIVWICSGNAPGGVRRPARHRGGPRFLRRRSCHGHAQRLVRLGSRIQDGSASARRPI